MIMTEYNSYVCRNLEKIFQNVQNFLTKIYRIHLHILCVHAKFRGKATFSVSCAKNTQKKSGAKIFFSTELYLFYTQHKKFAKQLCEQIECQDLHGFFFGFFDILNFV
jgi:hypothetical protein